MAKHLSLPPLNLLNKIFTVDYTSPSGLRWKINKGPKRAGEPAGTRGKRGYWSVGIKTDKTKVYKVHRIIYFMETGQDPGEFVIDHYGDSNSDNSSIRLATQQLNSAYSKKQICTSIGTPTSKYKGVTWFKRNKKWGSQIRIDGKNKFLGLYNNEKEAALKYNEEAVKRWGKFALINDLSEKDMKEIENFKSWQKENPSQTSNFKGVCWHKRVKKWIAKISIDKKRVHLGVFNTELEAARAYNQAAVKAWGDQAKLNLVD